MLESQNTEKNQQTKEHMVFMERTKSNENTAKIKICNESLFLSPINIELINSLLRKLDYCVELIPNYVFLPYEPNKCAFGCSQPLCTYYVIFKKEKHFTTSDFLVCHV